MLRLLIPVAFLVALASLGLAPAQSADVSEVKPARDSRVRELSEQGRKAVSRGLEYLARQQQEDGSWTANVGYKLNEGYMVTKRRAGHPGVTALTGMAFLAGGNTPGRGKYGKNVEAAIDYIIDCVNPDGMITRGGTRMYSHAFGTLFLAEVYGMTRDEKVKAALEKATTFTYKCQNRTGGWRYAPYAQDSDMSITVCQVMALRAARNIGIKVPRSSIEKAVNYVLESATTRGEDAGSFKYQYRKNQPIATRASFALTAAGLATLYGAGLYTDEDIERHIQKHRITRFLRGGEPAPRIDQILKYLKDRYSTTRKDHFFYYYGNYYAVQAMFIAGGKWWDEYFRQIQADLVRTQDLEDGSWHILEVGDTYATASACLILQIPYRYLPIFQR